jgi:TolA-binding protein
VNQKSLLTWLLVLPAFLLLTGCPELMTRNDVKETQQKKQIEDEVTTLQKSNADTGSRFDDIQDDLRKVHGRLDVVENQSNQSAQQRDQLKAALEQEILALSQKVDLLQQETVKLDNQMAAMAAANAKAAEDAAAAAAVRPGSAKTLFDVAEEQYAKKDCKHAILTYQKFRDTNPKSKKIPEATYKIGACFQELGMKDEAKTFFDDVIAKFPNSVDAKKAKIRLKSLKK